jgi:hypothetical protein
MAIDNSIIKEYANELNEKLNQVLKKYIHGK